MSKRRVGRLQHKVKVLPLETVSACELVFVQGVQEAGSVLSDKAVIVADSDSFSFPGTAIVFYKEGRKLRFEIDLKRIRTLKVIVSSELLKLARIK